jgi:hypothetical protein
MVAHDVAVADREAESQGASSQIRDHFAGLRVGCDRDDPILPVRTVRRACPALPKSVE